MIRHVVIMKFAPECTTEQHSHMLAMLRALEQEVDVVRALTVGAHVLSTSPVPDLALLVDLDDRDDLATYTTHPYHLSVGAYFASIKDSAAIVDLELP